MQVRDQERYVNNLGSKTGVAREEEPIQYVSRREGRAERRPGDDMLRGGGDLGKTNGCVNSGEMRGRRPKHPAIFGTNMHIFFSLKRSCSATQHSLALEILYAGFMYRDQPRRE